MSFCEYVGGFSSFNDQSMKEKQLVHWTESGHSDANGVTWWSWEA